MTQPPKLAGADFDHRDAEEAARPWDRWARLRAADSLGYSENYGGYYVASQYPDVCAISRDPEAFSSFPGVTIPLLASPPFPPINFDPPVNRIYREIVNPYFSPSKVNKYEPWIREIATAAIGPLVASGRFDFPVDLAVPVTREIIFRIMGITQAPEAVNGWSDDLIQQSPNAGEAVVSLMAFLAGELAARREAPGEDFMSGLAQARYEDRLLTDDEILTTSLLVLLAGLETTASAMSGSVWYLLQHPEIATQLAAADAKTWRLAMDEFVRWTSPASSNSRNVRADATVHGCPMHDGDKVLLMWGSANRDENEFPNAAEMVLDRHPNRHVGFGMGPHRCVGSHLAKIVMQAVFEGLVAELPSWEIADPAAVHWEGSEVRSMRRLELVRKS